MKNSGSKDMLRSLPAVDELLHQKSISDAVETHPRTLVVRAIRNVLDRNRQAILRKEMVFVPEEFDQAHLIHEILVELEHLASFTLRRVVNGTGIIVHTNLGRSLLCQDALDRLQLMGSGYSNLEYDLTAGTRGSRYVHAEAILCEITGAEAALVVNNNAGAVVLTLNTLAQGREVSAAHSVFQTLWHAAVPSSGKWAAPIEPISVTMKPLLIRKQHSFSTCTPVITR